MVFSYYNLYKVYDQLNLILKNLNRAFSVLGLSETWLTDSTSELVNITGYNFVSNHRKSKIGETVVHVQMTMFVWNNQIVIDDVTCLASEDEISKACHSGDCKVLFSLCSVLMYVVQGVSVL